MNMQGQKTISKPNGNSARAKLGVNLCAGLLAAASLSAYADTSPGSDWYFDGRLGRGSSGFSGGDVDGALATQGIGSATNLKKRDTTYAFDAGYQFSPYFALEGGYVDFGQYKFRSTISAPVPDTAHGKLKADGWSLAAVGILPLDAENALYGKAGLIRSKVELDAGSDTGAVSIAGTSKSGSDGLWGLGISHEFGNNVFGRLEWDRYLHLGDASTTGRADLNTYTLGVGYRF